MASGPVYAQDVGHPWEEEKSADVTCPHGRSRPKGKWLEVESCLLSQ